MYIYNIYIYIGYNISLSIHIHILVWSCVSDSVKRRNIILGGYTIGAYFIGGSSSAGCGRLFWSSIRMLA